MSLRRDLSLSRVPLAGFVAIGTGWGGFAAATPALKAHLSLSEAELGQALFFGALGAVLSMALAPRIIAWTGRGRGVIGAALAPLALGFACVGLTQNFAQFAMAIFLTGLSTGFIDVIINARISSTEAHSNRHLMSLNHGSFSLAYALAALVMGLGRETELPLSTLYALLGGLVLTWALLTLRDPGFEQIPPRDAKSTAPAPHLPAAVPLIGLMILLAFFAENSTEIWAALHIEQTLGGRAAQGALGPTMLGLTMAIGRFSGQGLASWYRYRHANQFQGTENGISHISFDDFIAATLSKDPPVWARIGSQDRFALDAHDAPRITDLFVYESLPRAIGFLEQKLGAPIVLPQKNVSPKRATPLRPDLLEALKQRRAREFRLYHAVAEAGHLVSR